MEYLYSRVSTSGQSTDPQLVMLKERFPNAAVVSEVASGVKARPMLISLIQQLEEGDVLIVAALDRLGRRVKDCLQILEDLEQKGVILKSLREGVDFSTPTGRLVTTILLSVAAMEREMLSERTKAGLAAARKKGRIGGRPCSIPAETIQMGIKLVKSGMSIRKASEKVGISHSYLRKKVAEQRQS